MIADSDTRQVVILPIERFWEQALDHALQRNAELEVAADQEGVDAWRKIVSAIEELQRDVRRRGEVLQ
jgi:hypothetical protein